MTLGVADTPFTLQQVVGAAERLRLRRAGTTTQVDWLALVEQAHARLNARPFIAHPVPPSSTRPTARAACSPRPNRWSG